MGQRIPEKEIVKEKPASTIAYEVSEFINLTITKHVGKVKDEELYSKRGCRESKATSFGSWSASGRLF